MGQRQKQKAERRAGLALWRGGRRPDQGSFAAAGPSEERAPQHSAAALLRRPLKKQNKIKI
ncbi:hypothetical protein SapgrDRAFT_1517 [Saprospira grandis DSM 2844]|uniref:Uncharacterized protein n=1 Tax=Saprospira grandis DSM 2844 TaxID=694433 RepID=J1I3F2_9BACT|nr:hypothetical protein SapgrDRAFT_1517 [Saprospira grandis DSM 2844]